MSVAIIDYGSGNLHSAAKAFERAARSMEEPQKILVTRDPDAVFRADRIVLPGVGAFADCRRGLDAVDGMLEAMTEAVRVKARPFFGICVGMQLMATRGKEHVVTEGFNWIEGDVEKITPREENLKIPHMGWNTLDLVKEHPVLERLPLGPKGRHAYFVHSYHLNAANEADVLARADYGGPVTAIVCEGHRHRHPVSPGKEPAFWAGPDFEFLEVEAVILFPAIDLKNGQCVRLEQGDMARATVFNLDPAAQARAFAAQGFEYLHVVDLDGAFAGKPMNALAVEAMLNAVTMPVQLGGGIRDLKTVEAWLAKGIARVIIGTAAVRDPGTGQRCRETIPRPRRGRARCARRQGRGRGLGGDLRSDGARNRAAFRGCRCRRDHLHRHRSRRPLEGSQSRCDHCAGRANLDPRDRIGRLCLDRRREGAAGAAGQEAGGRHRWPRAL